MSINKSNFSIFRSPFLRGALRVALLVAIGLMWLAGTATLQAGIVGITVNLNDGHIERIDGPNKNAVFADFVALPADLKVVGPIYWSEDATTEFRTSLERDLGVLEALLESSDPETRDTATAQVNDLRAALEAAMNQDRRRLFVYHNARWDVITGGSGKRRAVIQIDLSDGSIVRVHRPRRIQNAPAVPFGTRIPFTGLPQDNGNNPLKTDLDVVGPIYWASSSPGCLYINHHGNWYVICD